jgi:prevent-host-death family protein
MATTAMPASEAREKFAEVLDRAAHGERVVVTRHRKAKVALVPIADVELLESLEDEIDLELARAARARAEKEGTIPFDQILRDLDISV